MKQVFIDQINFSLSEFTEIIYNDYERNTILFIVDKKYYDEILKKIKQKTNFVDILFVKEIKNNQYTVLIGVDDIVTIEGE